MTDATAASVPPAPKGYRIDIETPRDSQAPRERTLRWLALLATTAITTLGPIALTSLWGSFVGSGTTKLGVLIGIAVAAAINIKLLPRQIASNPEWSAYVTLNPFNGENIPYGPGMHPTYFWEERNKEGNYSLEVITKTFSVMVQTKDAQVEANGMFQYQVDLSKITNFIGIDETTIETGLIGFIQSFLTARFSDQTAEEARKSIRELNQDLCDNFMGVASAAGTSVVEFEEEYGIRTVTVVVSGLKLPAAVQKARDAVDEAKMVFGSIAALLGVTPEELTTMRKENKITEKEFGDLSDKAMAISGNADMRIIKGDVGAALANTIFGGPGKTK